jgi:hypothetical protein
MNFLSTSVVADINRSLLALVKASIFISKKPPLEPFEFTIYYNSGTDGLYTFIYNLLADDPSHEERYKSIAETIVYLSRSTLVLTINCPDMADRMVMDGIYNIYHSSGVYMKFSIYRFGAARSLLKEHEQIIHIDTANVSQIGCTNKDLVVLSVRNKNTIRHMAHKDAYYMPNDILDDISSILDEILDDISSISIDVHDEINVKVFNDRYLVQSDKISGNNVLAVQNGREVHRNDNLYALCVTTWADDEKFHVPALDIDQSDVILDIDISALMNGTHIDCVNRYEPMLKLDVHEYIRERVGFMNIVRRMESIMLASILNRLDDYTAICRNMKYYIPADMRAVLYVAYTHAVDIHSYVVKETDIAMHIVQFTKGTSAYIQPLAGLIYEEYSNFMTEENMDSFMKTNVLIKKYKRKQLSIYEYISCNIDHKYEDADQLANAITSKMVTPEQLAHIDRLDQIFTEFQLLG